jgi:hypothetical protein
LTNLVRKLQIIVPGRSIGTEVYIDCVTRLDLIDGFEIEFFDPGLGCSYREKDGV